MEILLETLYKSEISSEKYHFRKVFIDEGSYQISGISQSGKTKLLKNYLLGMKKKSYLYIDCNDMRIDIDGLNKILASFCNRNKIQTLVLDNYNQAIKFANVKQLLISTQERLDIELLDFIQLYPLAYEEFLAYEHKYDSSALNHFFQLGGLPSMHKVHSDERHLYLQQVLKCKLSEMEFDLLCVVAKYVSQKLSAFTLYERLKLTRKVSKDKLYKSFESLVSKNYIHTLAKHQHEKATKKIYLCDASFKSALSVEKNFATLFENMVFLELLKSATPLYYYDNIDFYLPESHEIILCKPFLDERKLFKRLETIEAFLFTHSISKITAITMNKESSMSHPLCAIEIVPFDIWALGD